MKTMNQTAGERHSRPHSVTMRVGEDLFAARRRWMATKPAGIMSPVFII